MKTYARSSARIEQGFPKPLVGGSNPLGRAKNGGNMAVFGYRGE